MNKRTLGAIALAVVMALIIAACFCSCSTTKNINKESMKRDSSFTASSKVDSSGQETASEKTTINESARTEQEDGWELHTVDSGQALIIMNGTADDYLEIPASQTSKKVALPKSKKSEKTQKNTQQEKTETKKAEVKKEAAQTVAVTDEQKSSKKTVKRSNTPYFIAATLLLLLLLSCRFKFWPFGFLKDNDDDDPLLNHMS